MYKHVGIVKLKNVERNSTHLFENFVTWRVEEGKKMFQNLKEDC